MSRKPKNILPVEVMDAIKQSVLAALSNVQMSKPDDKPADQPEQKQTEFWFAKISKAENGDLFYDFRMSSENNPSVDEIIGPYPSFTQMRYACIERCKQFLKAAHDLRKTKVG